MGEMRETPVILVRTGLTVAGDAQHDEAGVHPVQHIPAEPPALHGAWPEALDDDIALGHQAPEQLGTLLARRLMVTDLRLRASVSQNRVESSRAVGVPMIRMGSPPTGYSILITSAPNSLSTDAA
jgi:hypothetical protein